MFRKILATAAAISMIASPVAAQSAPNPAAKLSLKNAISKNARSASPRGKSKLAGGGGFFVAIIAVIAVIAGVIIVANDDDSDSN